MSRNFPMARAFPAVSAAFLLGGAVAMAAPMFPNPQFYGAAPTDRGVRADFNGDGRPDLAVSLTNTTLAVSLGDGAGGFSPLVPIGAGGPSLAVGDFNGDGFADLAGSRVSGVVIYMGHGDGTFAPVHPEALFGGSAEIAAGDLNGDGLSDLAAAVGFGVQPLLGQPNGTFVRPGGLTIPATLKRVALADFNGDGKDDLAYTVSFCCPQGYMVGMARSAGDGSFSGGTSFSGSGTPGAIVVGDVDADGFADVAMHAFTTTWSLNAYFSAGTGTSFTQVGPLPTAGDGLSIGDLDGDGRPDLVTSRSGFLAVLVHTGPRLFAALPEVRTATNFSVTGDFDADGLQDLVLLDRDNAAYLGHGDGTIDRFRIDAGDLPTAVATADLDENGDPDLVAVTMGLNPHVSVVAGHGDGSFATRVDYPIASQPDSVTVCDVDGDGHQDVASMSRPNAPGVLSVLYGAGDGTLMPAVTLAGLGSYPDGLRCADLNRDGRGDLVYFDLDASPVSVVLGREDRAVGPETHYTGGSVNRFVEVGDVNEDGFADLVVGGDGLGYLAGNGQGTFGPMQGISADTAIRGGALGDFDRNGHVDLAIAQSSPAQAAVLFGNGAGGFAPAQVIGTTDNPSSIIATDLNRDGWPDIAVSDRGQEHYLSLNLGIGGGAFGQQTRYALGHDATHLDFADFDHDGAPDIAASTSEGLAVLQNRAPALPDLDGDGIADTVDDCVLVSNPIQTDQDDDSFGDACDCAPTDPGAFARPGGGSGVLGTGAALSGASLAGTAG